MSALVIGSPGSFIGTSYVGGVLSVAHTLEAAAAAQAAASAALSVAVPLAAAGLSVATATGALSIGALASAGVALGVPPTTAARNF